MGFNTVPNLYYRKNNKYKYIIMWIVLFSQIMLALWVAK